MKSIDCKQQILIILGLMSKKLKKNLEELDE